MLMSIFASIASHLPVFHWLNLPEELKHFSLIMTQQLDLRHEAYTLGRMSRNFSTWRTVHVPMPVYPWVSKSALVQTFAQGTSIGKFLSTDFDQSLTVVEREIWYHSRRSLATIGLQSFLQMLLWDNFVHADLHPGNILVRFVDSKGRIKYSGGPSGTLVHRIVNEDLHPQIVYLDTGLVTELSRRDFCNFNDLFVALVLRGDGRKAGKLIIERSPAQYRSKVVEAEEFCAAMDEVVRPIFRDIKLQLGRFAIGSTLFRVFDLVRKHHVHLDGSFTNLVMSFVCVEGLGRQLAPDLNLIPFLARAGLRYLVTNVSQSIP
jgi:aarF domain-containing kinase